MAYPLYTFSKLRLYINFKRGPYQGKKLRRWRSTQESFLIGRRPIWQRSFSQPNTRKRAARWNEGNPVEGNPVEVELGWPRCVHPHRRGPRPRSSPLRLFFLSLAHTSLRPLDDFNLLSPPSYLSSSSLRRVLRETLFSRFDSLIFFFFLPLLLSFLSVAEALALQVSAAPTSRAR